jgi:hypothetical protein
MQRKMSRAGDSTASQHSLKLASRFQSLQFEAAPKMLVSLRAVQAVELRLPNAYGLWRDER